MIPQGGPGICALPRRDSAHGCPRPAPEIAEIIAHIAVETLLDRLPDVVPAVPPESLEWRSSIQMRSLEALPVEFTPGYQI